RLDVRPLRIRQVRWVGRPCHVHSSAYTSLLTHFLKALDPNPIVGAGAFRGDSIQQRAAERFGEQRYEVVFDDDSKGEAADLVCLSKESDHTHRRRYFPEPNHFDHVDIERLVGRYLGDLAVESGDAKWFPGQKAPTPIRSQDSPAIHRG
ncbi:MAG: hypothetical protein WD009_12055, partial [Phycisphaeraceae bacterium]